MHNRVELALDLSVVVEVPFSSKRFSRVRDIVMTHEHTNAHTQVNNSKILPPLSLRDQLSIPQSSVIADMIPIHKYDPKIKGNT